MNTKTTSFNFSTGDKNLQTLIEGIPLGVAVCELHYDNNGKAIDFLFLAVNASFEIESGQLGANVLGKTIKEVNPNFNQENIDKYSKVVSNKKSTEYSEFSEYTQRHYKINVFYLEGKKFGFTFKDVTKQYTTHKALEKSVQSSDQLIDSMFEIFQLIELIYNDNGEAVDFYYRKVNAAFEKKSKKKNHELVGKRANEIFTNIEDYWLKTFERVHKTGKPAHFENYNASTEGYFRCSAWKTDEGKIACIFMDISDFKKHELELLKAKEDAKESDRLKSAFLANMSHEIRTPLNGLLGFTTLLKDIKNTPEQIKEYISIIEKSGERVLNTINDIIDISKIEAGAMKLNISQSNLNDHIEYIYTFFKPQVESKGLTFSSNCSASRQEAFVFCDSEKIYAILTNLLKNALKFTNKGHIAIGYKINDDFIEFYVEDSGIGIDKEAQRSIFERFIQIENYDTKVAEGTGLGLSICKAYAEMMGGKIWVESTPDNGSKFNFTIRNQQQPTTKLTSSNIQKTSNNISITKRLKIVVADDDEISNYLLSIILKKENHILLQATNGEEAVEISKRNDDIDLILMDIRMPILNGYQATEQIREFNTNVIIISQTAFGLVGDKEKAIAAGCNDYLTKPIDEAKLFEMIKLYFHK